MRRLTGHNHPRHVNMCLYELQRSWDEESQLRYGPPVGFVYQLIIVGYHVFGPSDGSSRVPLWEM